MTRRAIVSGGSIGGLFAAAALRRRGWDVLVCERVEVELSGRGAGIVTHPELIDALVTVGAGTEDLGVEVTERVAYDIAGAPVHRLRYPQIVTSWDRIHQLLRVLVPEGGYRTGAAVTGYEDRDDGVEVVLEDGTRLPADLLVGADGFRSAVRGQMLPQITPRYAGYVVWRAVTDEMRLPQEVHAQVFDAFGMFLPLGTQIIGYPIAGVGNDLRPGQRRYNFVWYSKVPTAELSDMLTDASGKTHEISIPPPLVREDILVRMEADARRRLPPAFIEILMQSDRPFFTPIYDHHSPHFAAGRVALCGDAACVARPHVGMGVTKAALDALALARHLDAAAVPDALQAYSAERAPAGLAAVERARALGGYIFDGPAGSNPDGRSNPRAAQIMAETATSDF